MKNLLLLIVVSIAPCCLKFATAQKIRCFANEIFQQSLQNNPEFAQEVELIEKQTSNYLRSENFVNGTITIPTVFHIVHNGDPVGTNENIAEEVVLAQLQQINDDFRRLNTDSGNTPADFTGVADDVEIEFCLAQIDPEGNPTSGIIRHQMNQAFWGFSDIETNLKPNTIWDRGSYLNFYIVRFGGDLNGTLGYAQFPGGNADTDAIVCGYQFIGSLDMGSASGGRYGFGRTATHEIGHWLNLRHIWGDSNCALDDLVDDTPNQSGPNFTSEPCTHPGRNSCVDDTNDLPDMFQNYMDYSDDRCMNLFTTGQKNRSRALFDIGGFRESLLNSIGCGSSCSSSPITTNVTHTEDTNISTTTTIVSTDIIPSPFEVNYRAGQSITLNTGFHAQQGSSFLATIEDCSAAFGEQDNTAAFFVSWNDELAVSPIKNQDSNLTLSAYPNPFNQSVTLNYQLLSTGSTMSLRLYNMVGKRVRTIAQEANANAGSYQIELHRAHLEPGSYFAVLENTSNREVIKLVLIK
ncbi:MAG: 3-coathanger stack domain-containing protein [Bacteroidota bacterium]